MASPHHRGVGAAAAGAGSSQRWRGIEKDVKDEIRGRAVPTEVCRDMENTTQIQLLMEKPLRGFIFSHVQPRLLVL